MSILLRTRAKPEAAAGSLFPEAPLREAEGGGLSP